MESNGKKTEVAMSTETHSGYILELKNITKTFFGGKIVANNDVSLNFNRNEVHALVGENGSGKSTLMNILFGLYKQDKGDIFFNGEKVDMFQSGAAKKYKVGMVHQHFHLVDDFSVLDNVILGQEKAEVTPEEVKEFMEKFNNHKQLIEDFVSKNNLQEKKAYFDEIIADRDHFKYKTKKNLNIRRVLEKKQQKLIPEKHQSKIAKLQEKMDTRQNWADYYIALSKEYKNIILKNTSTKLNKELYDLLLEEQRLIRVKESHELVGPFGILKRDNLLKRFISIQKKYNINLDPFAKVGTLAVGQRQMVEILKVLWVEKDLLVFDEPTATLSVVEIAELMKTIKALKQEGKTIVFISHKLQEVKEIADQVSVLRKGVLMGTYKNDAKLKPADIGKLMVGKTIKLEYPERKITGKDILKVENLSYRTHSGFKALDDVSFTIKEGEIFGLAGIEGNGQEEIVKILTNLRTPRKGTVTYKDELLVDNTGWKLKGLDRRLIQSHVPIDRLKYGVVPNKDLGFNAMVTDYDTGFFNEGKGKKINGKKLEEFTDSIISGMHVDGAFNHSVSFRNLSGGNQQKFVVGRELYRNHEIFIAGHPTRGLDISAIDNIYRQMIGNSKGKATLLYSLEISELMAVCDRMAILYKGKIVDIINPKKVSMDTISRMMIGEVK